MTSTNNDIQRGKLPKLDLRHIEPEPTVLIMEDYSDPEQLRRAWYIERLSAKDLKVLLYKSEADAEATRKHWRRFFGDRLSNLKRADHPVNGGDTIQYTRTYAGPKDGRPGRLYCAESLQDLYRPFRSLLLEPVASDADMSACSARISRWLAKEEGCKRTCLDAYLRDRAAWHRDCQLATGMPDRAIKDRINIMWPCRPGDPRIKKERRFSPLQDLHDEVQELKKHLYHQPKFQWAHKYCDADNLFGTFMGIVLSAIECKLTNECVRFAMREYGWRILAIVHDGFNPVGKFTNEANQRELRQFEAICEDLCPGLEMKWAWKPFDFAVYDKKSGEKLRELRVPPEFVAPEGSDDEEEGEEEPRFEGDGVFAPDYATKKADFERTRFKVNGRYVDYYTHENDPFPRMLILSESKCKENWKHEAYSEAKLVRDRHGNPKRDASGKLLYTRVNYNFLNRWLVDPEIKQYRRFVNHPDPSRTPDECYNMWKEYRVKHIAEWDRANGRRIVIEYLDFLHKMFGGVRKQTMFALDWHAHLFQHPGEKPMVMACLLGPQGGGKTTFLEVVSDMMGEEQCFVTSHPDQNVYGKNGTACIANKKFINVQEVDADKVRPYISGLRPIITDPMLEVKGMGQDPINIESVHAVGLSSNFLSAMTVDTEAERRFWIVYCTDYWSTCFDTADAMDAFFSRFKADLKSEDFLAEYHEFCLRRPGVPKRFNKKFVPIGELQKVSKAANEDWVAAFLRDMLETDCEDCGITSTGQPRRLVHMDGEVCIRTSRLERQLNRFVESRGWDKKGVQSLTNKLALLKVQLPAALRDGWVWDGERSVRCWYFDLNALRRWLKMDVARLRCMAANRQEYEALERVHFEVLRTTPLITRCPKRLEGDAAFLRFELEALQAEYAELAASKEDTADTVESFDGATEYERVMSCAAQFTDCAGQRESSSGKQRSVQSAAQMVAPKVTQDPRPTLATSQDWGEIMSDLRHEPPGEELTESERRYEEIMRARGKRKGAPSHGQEVNASEEVQLVGQSKVV